jgi:hypothetical protein
MSSYNSHSLLPGKLIPTAEGIHLLPMAMGSNFWFPIYDSAIAVHGHPWKESYGRLCVSMAVYTCHSTAMDSNSSFPIYNSAIAFHGHPWKWSYHDGIL